MGSESETGLGYCGKELDGHFIMGNSVSYVGTPAADIAASHSYNIMRCSRSCVESGSIRLSEFQGLDLILGLQKYSPQATVYYKTFTPHLQQQLQAFAENGGALLVSGSYVGSDMQSPSESAWLNKVLHCSYQQQVRNDSLSSMSGMNTTFNIVNRPNPDHYAATHSDVITPTGSAFCAMKYSNGMSAAVAFDASTSRTFTMGFTFETINDISVRRQLMKGIWQFLFRTL